VRGNHNGFFFCGQNDYGVFWFKIHDLFLTFNGQDEPLNRHINHNELDENVEQVIGFPHHGEQNKDGGAKNKVELKHVHGSKSDLLIIKCQQQSTRLIAWHIATS
jgi:hypothetical protein